MKINKYLNFKVYENAKNEIEYDCIYENMDSWDILTLISLLIKRFKFEALRVMSKLKNKTVEIVDHKQMEHETKKLLDIANNIYQARGNYIKIVHYAEIEALAAALLLESSAIVIDERTTRLLIEDPEGLKNVLEHKLHTKIQINDKNLNEIKKRVKDLRVIRSTELVTIAYNMGLLERFIPDLPNPKKQLLEGVLWRVKLNGCSVSQREIDTLVKTEAK